MSFNQNIDKVVYAETRQQSIERLYSYFDHLPQYQRRHVEHNWNPHNNVIAVRGRPEGSYLLKEFFAGANIVTDAGDLYYAQKAAAESPGTNLNFANTKAQWANPATQNSVAKSDTWDQFDNPNGAAIGGGGIKSLTATYPKRNDTGDADNLGDAVDAVAYAFSWATTDFNDGGTTIKNIALFENGTPVNATGLLSHAQITAFSKTSSDTLKAYVNHVFNGV